MSAESANQSANPSTKKRTFHTISNRKPQFFTFPNHKVAINRQRPSHNFSAVSKANVEQYYGHINTPKGGKRSGKRSGTRSGQRTRRHRTRRSR